MDSLVHFFIDLFGNVSKEFVVFVISMMPLLELRGGILAASLLGMDFIPSYIISIVGNVLPIPLILLLLEKIFDFLKKYKATEKFVVKLEKKILSKKGQIDKYGYLGLLLFVGIPLPGTGAWTGSALAVILHLNRKKAFIYIMLGVIMASIIMSILSFGLLRSII